jgi:NAD(P)-dependent dehydrogenase (short-subunit alcohol dehydrogenase family)
VTPPSVHNVNLNGKTAIVTGANTGIGFNCARQLLDLGLTKLIVAVRDEKKGHDARTQLLRPTGKTQLPDDTIEVWKLDYLSYESILAFAERAKSLPALDIAVLNAGVFKQKYDVATEIAAEANAGAASHEHTVQVNVLSTTLLAILLLPVLKPKNPTDQNVQGGRLAVVSSDVASWAKFKDKNAVPLLPTFDVAEKFISFERYFDTKLLQQLLIAELARRVDPSVAVITLPNPGLSYGTNLGRLPGFHVSDLIGEVLKRIFGRPAPIGARTVTAGAVKFGKEAHGVYVEDGKLQP